MRETQQETHIRRIKVPAIDTSKLIKDNELTLIGRLTNPKEQRIWALIPSLPRKWNLHGRVVGSDLGKDCFQFRFEREDDLQRVLEHRPYHFNYWMVLLRRWEPIISDFFPSSIPFWIRIKGLPLHYWDDDVVRNMGKELGHFEKHELTKTSARVRVHLDGLKPLTKETILEFDSGEESKIIFEYERLENHCSICNRLTHLSAHCPLSQARSGDGEHHPRSTTRETTSEDKETNASKQVNRGYIPPISLTSKGESHLNFHQRVDRHGRTFGDRVSTRQTRNPPPPGLKPVTEAAESFRGKEPQLGDIPDYTSPPYAQYRDMTRGETSQGRALFLTGDTRQWRVKQTNTEAATGDNVSTPMQAPPAIERRDQVLREQEIRQIPTAEEVMEDLHEVTLQYLSCADPTEAAARRKRVMLGDARGDMENTAARIVAAAEKSQHQRLNLIDEPSPGQNLPPTTTVLLLQSAEDVAIQAAAASNQDPDETSRAPPPRKRGRPAKLKSIVVTTDILRGTSSKKRNISRLQRSPLRITDGTTKKNSSGVRKTTTSQNQTSASATASANPPPIQLIPASTRRGRDFHAPPPPAL